MKTAKINREEVRSSSIVIPVTEAEKSAVQEEANKLGITLASFARMVLREHLSKK